MCIPPLVSVGNLHTLAASTVSAKVESVQQPQAVAVSVFLAPTERSRQAWAPVVKLVLSSEHIITMLMSGCGQLAGSQADLMSALQAARLEVRLVSEAVPATQSQAVQ